jgi:hypothetical protein
VSGAGSLEQTRVYQIRGEHDLAIVRGDDLWTSYDEVPGGLDVDDEVIALHLADGADLLTAFVEEHVIADINFKIVRHDGFPPSGV